MADGFIELNSKKLQTEEGVSELNRMLQILFENMVGDGDTVRAFKGYGSPESVVSASVGSLYLRLDGGVGSTIYAKSSGTGATGWSALS